MNGGYYVDHVSIMGMMGLPAMHHTTWDNLVSWVGIHVEWLAEWSCKQVRADIEKHGDKDNWTASFHGSRRAVVSHEAKKKQHAYASSGQCDLYSELLTRMVGLNF